MPARTRNRLPITIPGGTYQPYIGAPISTQASYTVPGEHCDDHLSTGYPDFIQDGPLYLTKTAYQPIRVTGKVAYSSGLSHSNVYTTREWESSFPGSQSMNYWNTAALARLNPNRPIVDVSASLLEAVTEIGPLLIGIARSSRDLYDSRKSNRNGKASTLDVLTPSNVAGAYVAYSFGIAPLIAMIQDILKLEESMEQREQEIKNARSEGTRISLLNSTEVLNRRQTCYFGASFPIIVDVKTTRKVKVWYEAKAFSWTPQIPNTVGVADRVAYRRKAALGLASVGLETLWEGVPFSWLIDYFTNLGTWFTALRGFANYSYSSACVMASTSLVTNTSYKIPGKSGPYNLSAVRAKGGYMRQTIKQRAVGGYPTWGWNGTILTSHQTNILLSIVSAYALARR